MDIIGKRPEDDEARQKQYDECIELLESDPTVKILPFDFAWAAWTDREWNTPYPMNEKQKMAIEELKNQYNQLRN